MDELKQKASIVLRGGCSIVFVKPIFTPDSKYLLCANGQEIKVLSLASGSCVRELRGHRGKVNGLAINPLNQYQVFSCSQDQVLIKWNYTDGIQLKEYHLEAPLQCLISSPLLDGGLLAAQKLTKQVPSLVMVTLPIAQTVTRTTLIQRCGRSDRFISVGCKGEYVASVFNHKLTICLLAKKVKNRKTHEHPLPHNVGKPTCMASHPEEYCVALGSSSGTITLWYNILKSTATQTVLHWHALPVRALCFTTQGSYLLSGGHEAVLLKWQHGSQHKDTLPRLGAPLSNIVCSPDNNYYATCHTDNVIQVISNLFKVSQVFQGMTRARSDANKQNVIHTGLLHDPRTNAVVLNGRPGHLQFYSLHNDKHLYNLDIVGQNYISPENLKRPLVVTEIECAVFSQSGDWLATFEYRDDKETSPEMRLKFWVYDEKTQNFMLNTNVDMPHNEKVTTLKFRPTLKSNDVPMVVSTSSDGRFKLWTLSDDTDIYRQNSCWLCESVGFYRDEPATEACFSEDGSLLAVAFGGTLTLWDPSSNSLRTALSNKPANGKIRCLQFGSGSCSHMLLCAAEDMLLAWNLLTASVQWTKKCPVLVMVQDPSSEYLAVFTEEKQLLILQPSSPEPIYTHDEVSSSTIISAMFLPRPALKPSEKLGSLAWQSRSQLYFMNIQQELFTFELESDVEAAEEQQSLVVKEEVPSSLLSQVLSHAKHSIPSTTAHHHESLGQPGAQYIKEMLLTPAHVLPPISSVCLSFLDQLVISSGKSSTKADADSSDEEDMSEAEEKSDAESDMEVEPSQAKPNSTSIQEISKADVSSTKTDLAEFDSVAANAFTWLSS